MPNYITTLPIVDNIPEGIRINSTDPNNLIFTMGLATQDNPGLVAAGGQRIAGEKVFLDGTLTPVSRIYNGSNSFLYFTKSYEPFDPNRRIEASRSRWGIGVNMDNETSETDPDLTSGNLFIQRFYNNGIKIDNTAIWVRSTGNLGIGSNLDINNITARLTLDSGTNNVSGLRFLKFNSTSSTSTGQPIGVDINGNIVTLPSVNAVSASTPVTSNANGLVANNNTLSLAYATSSTPGILSTTAQIIGGEKTFSSIVINSGDPNNSGLKLTGFNPSIGTGSYLGIDASGNFIKVASPVNITIGSPDLTTGNSNGAAITNGVLSLSLANSTFPGIVTTSVQTFAGKKTFAAGLDSSAPVTINSGTNDISGLTLTRLTSTSPTSTGSYLGVNSSGLVVTLPSPVTNISVTTPTTSNANGLTITGGNTISLAYATNTTPGILSTTAQTITGDKTINGQVLINSSNPSLSGLRFINFTPSTTNGQPLGIDSNGYVVVLPTQITSVGSPDLTTGTAEGGFITNGVLKLSLANTVYPGIVTVTTQSFAGKKTFTNGIEVDSGTNNVSGLRITKLTSASPTNVGQPIGVTATGDIVTIDSLAGSSITVTSPSVNSNINGLTLANNVLRLTPADITNPGIITNSAQSFSGRKTFTNGLDSAASITIDSGTNNVSGITFSRLNSTSPGSAGTILGVNSSGQIVTLNNSAFTVGIATPITSDANGASATSNTISLAYATSSTPGILSTTAQTITGAKTFSSPITSTSGTSVLNNLQLTQVTSSSTGINAKVIGVDSLGNVGVLDTIKVFATQVTGQSIPNTTDTVLTGWVATTSNAAFNAPTGVFTAPRAMTVQLCVQIQYTAYLLGVGNTFNLYIKRGSSIIANNPVVVPVTVLSVLSPQANQLSALISLAANDTITIVANQNSGAARSLVTTAAVNYLSIIEQL